MARRAEYEREIEGFLYHSDKVILTGHFADKMGQKQASYLYSRYTDSHAKLFLKPDTLSYYLSDLSEGKAWGMGIDGGLVGVASADPSWFEEGKRHIEAWIRANGGREVAILKRYEMCHNPLNALIGSYNEWDHINGRPQPRPFRFKMNGEEEEYWSFRKACTDLGYTVINASLDHCHRLGIYDREGRNLTPTKLNTYALQYEDRI